MVIKLFDFHSSTDSLSIRDKLSDVGENNKKNYLFFCGSGRFLNKHFSQRQLPAIKSDKNSDKGISGQKANGHGKKP
jgi:hypothetical protein